MAFAHLHVHTEYSLLDGSNKISEYVKRVKELGMTAAAITDHGVMYGVIDFYKAAKAEGINPVIGCEVYVAPNSRFDRETTGGEDRYYHLILLAENNTGYENLMKIVSRSFTEGYYYKPRVDMALLREHHEGIIALSACLAGEVARNIVRGNVPAAEEAALKYLDCFGKGNFFLELQDHGYPDQQTVNAALLTMSKKLDIPLVATNDAHYTYAGDAEAHDILLCIQTAKKLSDEDRMRYPGGQFYIKSEEEMKGLFPYAWEAVENTQVIADRCHVEFTFHETKLPKFEVPEGYTSWTYLNKLCDDGLRERYPDDDGTLRRRMEYELSVIEKMGYVDYFLIVWDYINFSRENGIIVGPGRGSAAGSVVSYCLKITNIDPIRYQLLFERFLNPERVSMPDIDVDFCFERRQEVIDYVTRKYGKDKVVQIITFGTMAAKGVLRDVGRVMDLPYSFVDTIAKMVPNELGITLEKALKMNPEMRTAYEGDERVHRLIDMSLRLEGLPRHSSVHAAGVVICQRPAEEFIPLSKAADGSITTQFTMTTVEELGLLKMDFLGLRTLTVIQNAVQLVNRSLAKTGGRYPAYEIPAQNGSVSENPAGVPLDIDRIDYDDKAVFASLATGRTDGVFQLESGGMQSFMKELKPESLEDLIAGISLYRPGPMDFIPKYVQGKNSASGVTYAAKELEPILAPTYGCIVYQEQVMQIVQDLGGYTLGRSDLVRRAMSKKKQSVMEKERHNFVYGNEEEGVPGCVAKGISAEVASGIYDTMMDFAKYAFNKSHAACYAVVSYQTAWLKYYYPTEFMAALMTSVIDFPAKVAGYILTCRSLHIPLLPPDINEGEAGFSVSNGAIRYALTAIKGIGRPVIDAVVKERTARGPFKDLNDFLTRLGDDEKDINKRVLENFIKAGAFDSFGATRKQLMSVYVQLLDELQKSRKNNMAGQLSLFDIAGEEEKEAFEIRLPDIGEYGKEMRLAFEKEVLGIYVSGHPLEEYVDLWKAHTTRRASDFLLQEEIGAPAVADADGTRATIGGMIADKKIKYTKHDKVMAFLTVEDLTGSVEVIVFPKTYEQYSDFLQEDGKVFVEGRISVEEERDAKLICEKITPFENIPKKLWIRFADREAYGRQARELDEVIASHGGPDQVVIYIANPKAKKTLGPGEGVRADESLLQLLAERFGKENVTLA
ncbi:MAG: DNA polymerase III subunit alpha [Eubacteriales bacterium]|nr:DNA polymerase III subunit alpha [Eubacteriales bacterium]